MCPSLFFPFAQFESVTGGGPQQGSGAAVVGQSRIGLPAFPKRFQKSTGSTAIYFAINLGYRKYKLRVAGLPAAKRPFWSIRPQLFWRLLVCRL